MIAYFIWHKPTKTFYFKDYVFNHKGLTHFFSDKDSVESKFLDVTSNLENVIISGYDFIDIKLRDFKIGWVEL